MEENNKLLTHGEMVQVIWLMGETHKDDEINQKLRFETIAEAQDSKTSRLVTEEILQTLLDSQDMFNTDFHEKYKDYPKHETSHISNVIVYLKSKYGIK